MDYLSVYIVFSCELFGYLLYTYLFNFGKGFKCELCGIEYNFAKQLNMHIIRDHSTKQNHLLYWIEQDDDFDLIDLST